jgi:RND superfamily putative drug exporter
MAETLYRLAKFAARRAFVVLAVWLLAVAAAGGWALTANTNLSTAVALDGIPSQQLIADLQQNFPEAGRGAGQIVFHKPDGVAFTEAEREQIAQAFDAATLLPGVSEAIDPFAAQAGIDQQREALATAAAELEANREQLTRSAAEIEGGLAMLAAAPDAPGAAAQIAQLEAARDQVAAGLAQIEAAEPQLASGQQLADAANGFAVISTEGTTALGTVYFEASLADLEDSIAQGVVDLLIAQTPASVQVEFPQELVFSLDGLVGIGEVVGLVAAAIVLIIMLRTFIGAGLPVVTALAGVAVSVSITLALSSQIEMTSVTPVLGVMLGLAVGIDYSLFILNRHRRQLRAGMPLTESIGMAAGTSGNAVVFAGFTVIIALLALNLTGIGFLGLMGTMGAMAIVIAVVAALTMVPALLGLVGERILSKRERAARAELAASGVVIDHDAVANAVGTRPVFANRHPWLTMLAVGSVLALVAIPAASLRLGLPDGGSEPTYSTQFQAYDLTAKAFGAGTNGRIITIVETPDAPADAELLARQADIAKQLYALEGVTAVLPSAVSPTGESLMFLVIPELGPASAETQQLVFDIRDLSPSFAEQFGGSVEVTGLAAINIDTSNQLGGALPLYLATVILLSFLLLTLVFRSLLVPLIATVGFLLTVFATLGAVVAVYQWGWLSFIFDVAEGAPILSFLPTILIGVLFGLAMDYQLFLVSGMREAYAKGRSAIESINYGVHLGRAVVIAAAIIMITVFGGFAFSHITMVRPMGFGLAIGVLIDAFMVRLLLMPALMTVLGKSAWWLPKWLDRMLPNVDVEGAKLEQRHASAKQPVAS